MGVGRFRLTLLRPGPQLAAKLLALLARRFDRFLVSIDFGISETRPLAHFAGLRDEPEAGIKPAAELVARKIGVRDTRPLRR